MLQLFNKFSYSSCTFSKLEKQNQIYHANLLTNGKPIYIQLPKVKTIHGLHWFKKRCYLDIELTKPLMDFFLNFEKNIIQTVVSESKNWFGKEMKNEMVESNFLSIVKLHSNTPYARFSIPINEELMIPIVKIYNNYKEKVSFEQIQENSNMHLILSCNGLNIGKKNLCFNWGIEQIKLDDENNTSYMFIEDEEAEIMEHPFYDEEQFETYLKNI